MLYCPPNVTLSDVWVNHGFSICFFNTVSTSIVGLFILIFGLLQLKFYRKYATIHQPNVALPRNRLFKLQVMGHLALTSLAIFNIVARHAVYREEVYGFEILDLVGAIVTWPMCLAVILVERHAQLPASPGHGHGAILLIAWSLALIAEMADLLSLNNQDWFFNLTDTLDKVEFGFWVTRFVLTFVIFGLGLKAPGIPQTRDYLQGTDEEAMLPDQEGSSTRQGSSSQGSTWKGLWRKLATLMPYMWPKKSCGLQLRVMVCLLLLVGVRVTNVYVPIYSKKIVDSLSPVSMDEVTGFCWDLILIFVALKFLQGGGTGGQGLLNITRSFLWIMIQQYTTREIQVVMFRHLHNLSLRWHLTRKTGEVIRIMDRGTDSINGLLSYLVFNILPTMIDIVVAIVYFSAIFNIWFGLIVFATMALYLGCTVAITEWRTKFRRDMNLADNEQRTKGVDSLLNFETVKYYNAEEYEIGRYEEAILKYQKEEWKSMATLGMLNGGQSVIINGGLLAGSLYCGYLVSERQLTVGDYVLFGTYILQLMVPLNFLGTLYRAIQESFINMENMLDLMSEKPDVVDAPNALPLMADEGKIEFRNVSFHYVPERAILKDISFVAHAGQTVALVGPTGSGKSTIVRLIFRFYDAISGAVLIDDQDVKGVTQESVRREIGVVPQDTVLFNDTLGYNINYGCQSAPPSDVESAAASADIHDKILTFPEGYDTRVGERGLKLSGGEKQRVAIARTILKAPRIVLLDEATSALDTQTERNIQNALDRVCADRTTIIVAHRLSTVTHADCILVLKDGEIVERGRHEELLAMNGMYWSMWNQQSQTKEDSEAAASSNNGAEATAAATTATATKTATTTKAEPLPSTSKAS